MEYITSAKNQKILNFSKLIADKKERYRQGIFVIEGEKMFFEALKAPVEIDTIIMSQDFFEKNQNFESLKKVLVVPKHIIEKISDTKSPQGVIFSVKMPENNVKIEELEKIIILDEIKDPGNMGTIIRTAVAFGIEAIILLNNCVDHFSPKVVRSTMSGIWSVPIIPIDVKECFENIKVPIYATYLDDKSLDITEISLKQAAVIIGNESKGVSDEVLSFATKKIIIPINGIESLNAAVAASIVMWEMSDVNFKGMDMA